jgi:acyl carrier protein
LLAIIPLKKGVLAGLRLRGSPFQPRCTPFEFFDVGRLTGQSNNCRPLARRTQRITEAASFDDDLAATRLDRVEVVMALENAFSIAIFDAEAAELHTGGDVLACVAANVPRQAPP